MKEYKEIFDLIKSNKVKGICFDSREVEEGFLFIAQKGTNVDGHKFINTAISKGAKYIVCEFIPEDVKELAQKNNEILFIVVKNSSNALGYIASEYYDNPSKKLKIVGITGTNGKTTTVTLLHNLFMLLGYKVGLVSTIVNKINNREIKATHTTPNAIELNKLFNQMVVEGCEFVFMEVSSHAIVQNRIAGVDFTGGIFSNITHDHLDFHKTFASYIKAKKAFFDNLSPKAFALTNVDDQNGMVMLQNTKAKKYTYSLKTIADFHAIVLENDFEAQLLNIEGVELWTKLIGQFNAYNVLVIYSTAILLGLKKDEILKVLSQLEPAQGRFDSVSTSKGTKAIIDYAHTPDALINVIKTINQIRKSNGRLITVVGCGGDRDKTKRPIMAKIAAENSDTLILTSDNPRTEEPEEILKDMQSGLDIITEKKSFTIVNRHDAIKLACQLANKEDVILVAGKGHETYQEVNGVRHHFDDKEEVLKY
ncbi:MAG: UDP-N-acetylmuramoyl-L-alanyl-D-glutamate--2,6-diaminopimelate ligase [Bacteroidaceae bacterium]|nr:UDP-N-acetylmuramoyl-L-alanyl-D-glutamate--2,6-diaminopimelate ligase [Bacteroidales bacterium]MEA4967391.1 UDP-N-acetylmuramoyl-L-alanyl-D-glutamate--2,6-diaminopimelate ligase [Bacteroidaceae bacterium]MEA5100018.1 UDP-N-acetylmuramoyl-L-alanyl-D-glutamate--2,6-diaminopimelate ligase [Bacteroidales bacterium]